MRHSFLEEFEQTQTEEEQCKQLWACYGIAVYLGQCVETGLVSIAVMIRILNGVDLVGKTSEQLEGQYSSKTLGQLLKAIERIAPIPEKFEKLLSDALGIRNELVHRYWQDSVVHMESITGRRKVCSELDSFIHILEDASHAVDEWADQLMNHFGVSKERIVREMERMQAEARVRESEFLKN